MSKRPFDAFDYIIDDGTVEDPLYDIEEYRNRKSCVDGIDPNGSQILLLRITGTICVIFGIIEITFGSYLFDEFATTEAGAWWAVLLLLIAGEDAITVKFLKLTPASSILSIYQPAWQPVLGILIITFQQRQYELFNCLSTSQYLCKFYL